MNKFDFAADVIKASPLARLTDRAFLMPVIFVCLVWIAALSNKTSIDKAIDFTKWIIVTFIGAEKGKDALTSWAALVGGTPQTVTAGGNLSMNEAPVTGFPATENASIKPDSEREGPDLSPTPTNNGPVDF